MITSPTLLQAREALVIAAEQRLTLSAQVASQARKITELEREIQKVHSALSQTQQHLADAKQEISALRSQLPDEATERAFSELTQYLTCPAEVHPEMRLAA